MKNLFLIVLLLIAWCPVMSAEPLKTSKHNKKLLEEVHLRPFFAKDLDAVLSLFRSTIHEINIRDYTKDQVNAWAPMDVDKNAWESSLSTNKTFVAEDANGKILGFADLAKDGYLDRLYVHKDYQGCGIASKLLKALEKEALSLNLSKIYTEASITARPFFEAKGFNLVKENNKEYQGQYFTNFSMEKVLEKSSLNSPSKHEVKQQIDESLSLLKATLGKDLLGVYLFGSSLVGGLQKYSDLDLFVVTNRATTSEEKEMLTAGLLPISGLYMKSSRPPIEMTFVEKTAVNPWKYPPRFDFQYGEWLRASFEKGITEPWQNKEMPDLALIITQILLKSQTLWGASPQELLSPVPYRDFMHAMLKDLDRLSNDLESDTRNVLLTYARIWSTLENNAISSKPAAADWVMQRLSEKHQLVMKRAKSICTGVESEHWDDLKTHIKPCADFMADQIKLRASLVNLDDTSRPIKLAEEPLKKEFPRGKKNIEVVPYDSAWPEMFKVEAQAIKEALKDNCIAVHHVGSTSVPGLQAKPKIDIIAVVIDPAKTISPLKRIGIQYRGEYNIPMHYGFSKRGDVDVNLHVYAEGNPEIELNLLFRDYLRSNSQARDEYGALKESILTDETSHLKSDSQLPNYTLRKGSFIRKILNDTGFDRIRMLKCSDEEEWNAAKNFRQKNFFDKAKITDPYTWTFNHSDHEHLILYQGTEIVGYAHVQLWPEHRAALRIIVVDTEKRNLGLGKQFMSFVESWLSSRGIKSLHTESSPKAVKFYKSCGYLEMPFNDPDGYPSDSSDTPMEKLL